MSSPLHAIPVYHITHVDNLADIVSTGGLISDILLGARPHSVIGYDNIKRRRMTEIQVGCCPGTFVGHFVPFYYCPRSPMLYVVNQGRTGKPKGCQKDIVHLVTTVGQLVALGHQWAISDSNAGSFYAQFSTQLADIGTLNWRAIQAPDWRGEVLGFKQAEFLVRDSVPWHVFNEIGCYDANAVTRVTHEIRHAAHQPQMAVKKGWYY
ncbi:DUF4433 domain-containing protein [Arenimonas sp.]|uniref:type II toxin-antitoxin system toxin DNA ADP-ribosyl transferase DarT n=1 Tax=Arenimonas sp. TaxID=1872635 RepID=UPI0039E22D9B